MWIVWYSHRSKITLFNFPKYWKLLLFSFVRMGIYTSLICARCTGFPNVNLYATPTIIASSVAPYIPSQFSDQPPLRLGEARNRNGRQAKPCSGLVWGRVGPFHRPIAHPLSFSRIQSYMRFFESPQFSAIRFLSISFSHYLSSG